MRKAKKAGAEIAHFPECALSGYVGFDFPNFDGFDWELLKKAPISRIIACI
jgi:predicted amidohydrolase